MGKDKVPRRLRFRSDDYGTANLGVGEVLPIMRSEGDPKWEFDLFEQAVDEALGVNQPDAKNPESTAATEETPTKLQAFSRAIAQFFIRKPRTPKPDLDGLGIVVTGEAFPMRSSGKWNPEAFSRALDEVMENPIVIIPSEELQNNPPKSFRSKQNAIEEGKS